MNNFGPEDVDLDAGVTPEADAAFRRADAVYKAFTTLVRAGLGPACFYYCVYCRAYFTPYPRDPDENLDLIGYPVDGCPGCCDVMPEGLLVERAS